MTKEIKKLIEQNIKDFGSIEIRPAAENLLNTLGYHSSKKASIDLESLKKRAKEKDLASINYALWEE